MDWQRAQFEQLFYMDMPSGLVLRVLFRPSL